MFSNYSEISQKKYKEKNSFKLLPAIFLGCIKVQELHYSYNVPLNKV